MGTYDDNIAMTDMDEAMDKIYELDVIPQETRFGATTQHIPGDKVFSSQDITVEMLKFAYHGATMSSSLEGDAPDAFEIALQQMTIGRSDLRELAFTLEHTLVAQTLGKDREHSAYEPAKRLVMQAMANIGERRNQALNMDVNCVKALVAAKYDADGTTYTSYGSGAAQAFLQIDNGSISMFHPGEMIDIRNASDGTDPRIVCQVMDVCHTTDFMGVSDIGPGITIEYDSSGAGGTYAGEATVYNDTNFDNVADNDEIVRHGEGDAEGYSGSFGTLIDLSSSPADYFSLARTTIGNYYLVPYGKSYLDANSANVNLNLEDHFGEMVDTMAMVIGPSRIWRGQNDFALTKALVAQAQPDLVNEIARQAGGDNARFTREIASKMSAARKAEFVANAGWDGAVLHHPGFPPIIVQPEPLCPANKIRMFEPSAWSFYRLGGKEPNWIRNDTGGRWHIRRNATTGNLTKIRDASAYVHETVVCDQPKTVYQIEGVKSTLKSS